MPTASFVGLPLDGPGKKMDNVHLTNPSSVEVEREVVSVGDPDTWGAIGKVSNAMPQPGVYAPATRLVAPEYDSGIQTLPSTVAAVTTDTIRAYGILLVNRTNQKRDVNLQNTAGDFYLKDYPLQRNQSIFVILGKVTMVGAKWFTDQADAVNAQLVGEK